jgi:phage repressor protein C with HTH and peptisase S24 domain
MSWDRMGLVTKLIERESNSEPPNVVIKSVNRELETYNRDAEKVHLIGRVVWSSRRL